MKLGRRDLGKLGRPLLGALGSLAMSGALLGWSSSNTQKAMHERDAARTEKNRIEQRLGRANGEAQDLAERARTFRHLQQSGIVGNENRLEWAETLRTIQRDQHLPGLGYEFGVRAPLNTGSNHGWFSSPLRLQLQLLHEVELLNFLERLEKEAGALVMLNGCQVTPLDQPTPLAQLSAECRMQWITVQLAGENR